MTFLLFYTVMLTLKGITTLAEEQITGMFTNFTTIILIS